MLDSAEYFDFPVSKAAIENDLERLATTLDHPHRFRLLLDREGKIEITSTPFSNETKPIRASLAVVPVDSQDKFLFHKTTHRRVYDAERETHPDRDDILLYNESGELTEFTIGNLVIELDGDIITPPVRCGLLAGTFRAELLGSGKVTERVIPRHRLKECTKIYRVNSIRQWQEVIIL